MKKFHVLFFIGFCLLSIVIIPTFAQQSENTPAMHGENLYPCEENLIEVMFHPESQVRLRNGDLVDLSTDALSGLNQILSKLEGKTWFRICDVPEKDMDEWSSNGQKNTGHPVYNMNNIYRLEIPGGKNIWSICSELEELPGIISAKPVPKPIEPPLPPNYQPQQGYLNPASSTPTGIDASYAWTKTGGTGNGVTICDLEYSWNYNHADISKGAGSSLNSWTDPGWGNDHGTAVIGELVSDNNGWGTTGICYGSNLKTCGTYYGSPSPSWNVAGAIAIAVSNLNAGDIILLEQQWDYSPTGGGMYVPIEWWYSTSPNPQSNNPVYAAITNAISNGIHVVEAGGNGNVNTDGMTWFGNSGAIIVGAGGASAGNDLQRLGFSSYGQRFDLQGWGENVFTTGYGSYYSAEGVNYYYTSSFNGTSSASPIVTGALACAEGYYLANISTIPPTPAYMRTHLTTYGTAQVFGTSGKIGPRPDLNASITNFPPPQNYYDWGDAPDLPYPTLSTNNGANHQINPAIFLGNFIDAEANGQPNFSASGDDLIGGPDDEDGVTFNTILRPGSTANITVVASIQGFLNAWIDLNGINIWSDPGEQIFTNLMLMPGPNNLTFSVPATAMIGNTYARFRFSSLPGLVFLGPATDGEVEDYAVFIDEPIPDNIDWGDAPDAPYPTYAAANGASHMIDGITFLGGLVDGEPDGQPDPQALGDDNDIIYPPPSDDEDGVNFTSGLIQGQNATVDVIASVNGILNAWFDFNANGSWADPGEQVFVDLTLNPGLNSLAYLIPAGSVPGQTFARFRFSSIAGLSFMGAAPDGEVEDYEVFIEAGQQDELDWGDAPDAPYPTLASSMGANHFIIPGIFLGNSIDGEPDGQPEPQALGDDIDIMFPPPNDDEDGVIFTSALIPGQVATVDVVASQFGLLNAWVDFNQINAWADNGEQIFTDFPLNPGLNNLTFIVPANAQIGLTFARFRFSLAAGISYFGNAPEGEVEDYQVSIGSGSSDIQIDPDPNHAFVQNEISMAITSALVPGTTNLLAAYNDTPYPGGPGLGVSYSNNGGLTWTPLQLPYPSNPLGIQYLDMFDPSATADGNGNFYVAHISTDYDWANGPESGLYVHKSVDGGITWNAPVQIAYNGKPTGSPDPNYRFNDRCQMTCDINTTSPYHNNLYIVEIKDRGWNMPLPYSDIYFSTSTDGGLTWSAQVILNNGTNMGNMPVPAAASDGTIYVCWIDYNVLTGGTGTIYLDVSSDGGLTWLPADILVSTINLPPLNLNGGTDLLAKGAAVIDVSPGNPQEVYIVYAEQIVGSIDEGDIYFIKSTDGGVTWTIPLRVNDDATSNDQVLPWMDVKPNGIIDIAWYDRRNDPADLNWDVFFAASIDGGNSFIPNQQVNSVAAPSPNTPSGLWMGEYLGLVVDNSNAYIGFTSSVLDINGDVFFNMAQNPTISIDYGDANDPSYPTLFINNGARHNLDGITFLGNSADSEPDGQPDPNALGDDNDGNDDEDGIIFNQIIAGSPAQITASTSVAGYLQGWMDFNADGDWADPGEQIFTDEYIHFGYSVCLNYMVPLNANIGTTYARFRFCSIPGISYYGPAPDGEVEDYEVEIIENPDIKWIQEPCEKLPGLHAHDYILPPNYYDYIALADDWLCNGGLVTDIHWWGNYEVDVNGQEMRGSGINHFHLSIHANDPTICLPGNPEIWGVDVVFSATNENNTGLINSENGSIYEYDYILDIPFDQEQGMTYWLDITAYANDPNNPAIWRWQESDRSTVPVLCPSAEMTTSYPWQSIVWNTPQPTRFSDMAFIITSEEIVEEIDFGDANDGPYPTLLSSNGALHFIDGVTFLGMGVDPEPNGQPDPNALGDDNDGNDDEDGVVFDWPLAVGNPCKVTVIASVSNGLFSGWIDFNSNGSWADPGEQVFADIPLVMGNNSLNFIVPAGTTPGLITYARFRFSTQPGLSFDGPAQNGEVEDYEVEIIEIDNHKWAQYPGFNLPGLHDHDYVNAGGGIERIVIADDWLCNGGLVTDIHWWGNYELDPTGQELRGMGINHFHLIIHSNSAAACLPVDPEIWGVDIPFGSILETNTGQVNIENCPIYLYEYILDIPFEQDSGTRYWLDITAISIDPNQPAQWRWQESMRSFYPILCGAANKLEPNILPWSTIQWLVNPPHKYSDMAFIITSQELEPMDFGDANDPTYPTLLANDGARHMIDGITFMGASIDPEFNGQPHPNALGDDNDGNDDEDGVSLAILVQGQSSNATIIASVDGYLNAWIDFNGNGNWSDAGEQIASDVLLFSGTNTVTFHVPLTANAGITYARFRFSTNMGLNYIGLAPNGEVEDYEVEIEEIPNKWAQYPDTLLPGLHAYDYSLPPYAQIILADDWVCDGGWITDIHWWGNYELDPFGQEIRGAGIAYFHLSIHTMDPTGCLPQDPEIWGVNVPFLGPAELNTGLVNLEGCSIYLYEYILDEPFPQVQGQHYWLDITAVCIDPLNPAHWRWQESSRMVTPILCGAADKALPNPGIWQTIQWANLTFSDMAFVLTSEPAPVLDMGDAGDPPYPTLLINGGAAHIIDGVTYLGSGVDADPDGQPDPNALGDDNDGNDDEDGVAVVFPLYPNGAGVFNVTASVPGFLSAWIDYNANGSWAEADEHVFIDEPLSAGGTWLVFNVPVNAKIGNTYARFRFSTATGLSYTGIAPNGEVEDYELTIEGDVDVNLKVFLEGPYTGTNMTTILNGYGVLPNNQPYNSDPAAIWYYTGSESVSSIPNNNITDWVVVEFRDAPSAPLATGATRINIQAAFLLSDGSIVGLDGTSPLKVNGIFTNNLFVVIWHRNHLGILSANPLVPSGINQYSYDFTTGPGQAYLAGQKDLGGGIYGMIGGDGQPDGIIFGPDIFNLWSIEAGTAGYLMGDFNMDTQVDNKDKNDIWYPNNGAGTQVP